MLSSCQFKQEKKRGSLLHVMSSLFDENDKDEVNEKRDNLHFC